MQNDFLTDAAWGPVGGPGVRYDSEFQQKVVRLAIRLEQEQRDALTPSELEMAAGRSVSSRSLSDMPLPCFPRRRR